MSCHLKILFNNTDSIQLYNILFSPQQQNQKEIAANTETEEVLIIGHESTFFYTVAT